MVNMGFTFAIEPLTHKIQNWAEMAGFGGIKIPRNEYRLQRFLLLSGRSSMERYYFHIRDNGRFVQDDVGEECLDLQVVQWEAELSAREIIFERINEGRKMDGALIEVHDHNGAVVHRVKLADLIH
jgi:hypothetical protein